MKKHLKIPVLFFVMLVTFTSYAQSYQFGDYIQFGKAELSKKRFTEAINYLNNAIRHRPANYEGYFLRGIAKYELQDYIGAEKDFSIATQYDPYNSEIFHYRAIVRSRQYNYGGALADYNKAILLNPKNVLFYLNRSRAKLFLQEYKRALADLDKTLELKYRHEEVYLLRGMAYSGLEQYDQSLAEYGKALKKNPKYSNAWVQKGSVWMELEQADSAIYNYNKALEINPFDSYALFNRAIAYIETDDTTLAYNDLNTVIELSPRNSYAYYNRAILEIGRRNIDAALEDLDRVIALNPDNIVVYLYRGRIKRNAGKRKAAIADFDKAIEIYPDFADAYYERAETKKQMSDFQGAEKDMQLAYMINDFNFKRSDTVKIQEEMYLKRLMAFSGDFKTSKNAQTGPQDEFAEIQMQHPFHRVLFASSIEETKLYDTFGKEAFRTTTITLSNETSQSGFNQMESELLRLDQLSNRTAEEQLEMAELYAGMQDFNKALEFYSSAIRADDDLIMAYFGKANVRLRLIELMSAAFNEQFLLSANDSEGINDPGTPSIVNHSYEQVLTDLSQVISLDPEFSFAWYNRGYVRSLKGDYWGAVRDLTEAIRLNPELAEAYYNKGLILIFQNLKKIGCEDMSQAGELGIEDAYPVLKRFCVK